MKPNILIRGGIVIDGTGTSAFKADVEITADRITRIGSIDSSNYFEVLDADGLIVSPGFIDSHSHSDFTLLVDPRAVSSITQGVTAEVVGNCGYGSCPIANKSMAHEVIYGFRSDLPLTWETVAGYLDRLEEARPAVNVLTLVPNGQLRLGSVGAEQRPANKQELSKMKYLLRQGLEEGAFGYSTGLEYSTEIAATEEEITELCKVTAEFKGIYATHTRNRDEGSVEAVAEAIRTAENAGVALQISHITPRGPRENTEKSIGLVDAAIKRGNDIAFDMHTRFFGTTYLKVLLPSWALEGGKAEIAKRLSDKKCRAEMKKHRSLITALNDWSRIVLLDNPTFPEYSRLNFSEIATQKGCEPIDAAYDILLGEIEQLHRPFIILHSYTEDLLRLTYQHPSCLVGSDATALAPDGPLSESMFHGSYTWASWFYRRMIRETATFTPEEGIKKLTSQVAKRFGIKNRGILSKGSFADVVVFDPMSFGEKGTTFEPNQIAQNMRHVIVNGVVTLRNGELTGERGGAVLRMGS
tara:strand:- start:435 stop:2012 length:1578 start_codon:yes stop_codon:yes gene_type:complete